MTPSPVTAYLKAVEARTEAATPGPWGLRPKEAPREVTLKRRHWELGSESTTDGLGILFGDDERTAQFIAHARTDLPRLVRMLRLLEGSIGEVCPHWIRYRGEQDPLIRCTFKRCEEIKQALATLDRLATEEEGR